MINKLPVPLIILFLLFANKIAAMEGIKPAEADTFETDKEQTLLDLLRDPQVSGEEKDAILTLLSTASTPVDDAECHAYPERSFVALRPPSAQSTPLINLAQLKNTLVRHTSRINCISFHPQGVLFLVGSDDKIASLWERQQSQVAKLNDLTGHTQRIIHVGFTYKGRNALSGAFTGSSLEAMSWTIQPTLGLDKVSPKLLGATCYDTSTKSIYAVAGVGKSIMSLKLNASPMQTASTSLNQNATSVMIDHRGIYALCAQGWMAKLFDITQFPPKISRMFLNDGRVNAIDISSDDKYMLTAGDFSFTLFTHDRTAGPGKTRKLKGHGRPILAAAFSHNDRYIASGSDDKTARLWDLSKTPITVQTLQGHATGVHKVAFCHADCHLLTVSKDGIARLWDITQNPAASQILNTSSAQVTALAFSPTRHEFLMGFDNGNVELWEIGAATTQPAPQPPMPSAAASSSSAQPKRAAVPAPQQAGTIARTPALPVMALRFAAARRILGFCSVS